MAKDYVDSTNHLGLLSGLPITSYGLLGNSLLSNFDIGSSLFNEMEGYAYDFVVKRPMQQPTDTTNVSEEALAGTLTFTISSTAVTGSGTAFQNKLRVGDWIRKSSSTPYYKVKTLTSDTALVLETAYEEASGAGAAGGSTRILFSQGAYEFRNKNALYYVSVCKTRNPTDYYFRYKTSTVSTAWGLVSSTGATGTDILKPEYPVTFAEDDLADLLFWSNGYDKICKWHVNYTGVPAGKNFSFVSDKSGTATALTGTLTFTESSIAVTGAATAFTTELRPGNWIRRESTGTWYEVKNIVNDTSLNLRAVFAQTTGAGGAGTSQVAPYASARGRWLLAFKNRLLVACDELNGAKKRVYYSTKGDFEDFSGDGSGIFTVEGNGGNITGLSRLGNYMFIWRQTAYDVYRTTGNMDAPYELVRKFNYGCESQFSVAERKDSLAYRSNSGHFRVTNGVSDESISEGMIGLYGFSFTTGTDIENYYTLSMYSTPPVGIYDGISDAYRYFTGGGTANAYHSSAYCYFFAKAKWSTWDFASQNEAQYSGKDRFPTTTMPTAISFPFNIYLQTNIPHCAAMNLFGQIKYFDLRYSEPSAYGYYQTGIIKSAEKGKNIKLNSVTLLVATQAGLSSNSTSVTFTIKVYGRNIVGGTDSASNQLTQLATADVAFAHIAGTDYQWKTVNFGGIEGKSLMLVIYDNGSLGGTAKANYGLNEIVIDIDGIEKEDK